MTCDSAKVTVGDRSPRKVTDGCAGEGVGCVMILRGTERSIGTIGRSAPSEQPCTPGHTRGSHHVLRTTGFSRIDRAAPNTARGTSDSRARQVRAAQPRGEARFPTLPMGV